jgi:hypothetical protein
MAWPANLGKLSMQLLLHIHSACQLFYELIYTLFEFLNTSTSVTVTVLSCASLCVMRAVLFNSHACDFFVPALGSSLDLKLQQLLTYTCLCSALYCVYG